MSYNRQSILFLNGLDKKANENMLYHLFNEFPISYIKIAKDHQTRESFGYAFIGFKNHAKAEEAIQKLNYSKVGKKTIRISWYNREPSNNRNNPNFNIFVKKIPKNVDHKEFHDYFSKFGNIISAKLVEDEEGEIVGYGFVLYDNMESAEKAIKETNGVEWKGKTIFSGHFIKNRPKKPILFNNIYIRNIPKEWSSDDIKKHFSKYGEFGSILIREPDVNQLNKLPAEKRDHIMSHKYAFICYKNFDSAMKAAYEVPYYKLKDETYNGNLNKIISKLSQKVEEKNYHKCATYIIENNEDFNRIISDENLLVENVEAFKKYMKENDDTYLFKDKSDRLDCCQALKKKDRIKRLKHLYEKIKKQIKEKYRFCNLYVKNLPDGFDEANLKELFSKYGEIRSCKTNRKELYTSYLGIKRSVKVFGFVCFFDAAQAREAKNNLHGYQIGHGNQRLFVDYHQTKNERNDYLKLKMISYNNKMKTKGIDGLQGVNRNIPNNGQVNFGPHMLRKFPPQTSFMQPYPTPVINLSNLDKNARRDYYGEQLFTKISSNKQFGQLSNFYSKIVGIFLDLDDHIIERLINDELYFTQQVSETVRLLREKTEN